MVTYSVKQIAEMLDTNPETVRRWIRDKKMNAVQISRKDGNVVTEDELQRFLKASPKYMPKFTASVASGIALAGPAIGIPVILGTLLGGKMLGYLDGKKDVDVRVRPDDVKKYIAREIEQHKKAVQQKHDTIKQLEKEIAAEEQRICQLQYMLEHNDQLTSKLVAAADANVTGKDRKE